MNQSRTKVQWPWRSCRLRKNEYNTRPSSGREIGKRNRWIKIYDDDYIYIGTMPNISSGGSSSNFARQALFSRCVVEHVSYTKSIISGEGKDEAAPT